MKTVAIVSAVGGAGRTSVVTALASLIAQRTQRALAIECDPCNVLGFHFGLREPAREGLVSQGRAADDSWADAALRSDDGVLVLPWGSDDTASLDARLHTQPHWLRDVLERIDLGDDTLALIDTPTWPSIHAQQAIAAADLVLALLPPSPGACATLPRFADALARSGRRAVYVAHGVVPARQLHIDTVALLRARLGAAMLPYVIHADAGVPEALARGENFCLSEPGSQTSHDLNGLAAWLAHWAEGTLRDAQTGLAGATR